VGIRGGKMAKITGIVLLVIVLLLVLVGVGYCIHLKLGSEGLNAWGAYLTGGSTLILSLAAVLGGSLALKDYRARAVAEKSKWLLQLYEKMFEEGQFKEVRRKLDYDDTDEIKALIKADLEGIEFTSDQQVKFDNFTDYLNFFELIAHLRDIGQLTSEDMSATFDYYLKLLIRKKNPEIRQYLRKEGFENLDRLLIDYER
jgi:hypothetical protein